MAVSTQTPPDHTDEPSPQSLSDVHNYAAGSEKISPADVSKQAGNLGNVSQAASDLGDHLRSLRDEVQRTMSGKDADAIAAHIDKLAKASHQTSEHTRQAQAALQDVTHIMESVKAKVKNIAEQAKEKDKSNRQLIADTKAKKKDDLESAAGEIEKLRQDNEHMSGEAKKAIEEELDRAEKAIDNALKPLGIEMEDGGFVAIQPAGQPSGATSPQGATGAPIDTGGTSSSGAGGGSSTAGATGASGAATSTGSSSSGGSTSSSGGSEAPSGPAPKPLKGGEKNPAKIAEHFLGVHAEDLKKSGKLPMDPGVPSDVCCANFTSACLQKAGLIDWHSNSVSSGDLQNHLKQDGWQVIPASEAKAGDVAIVNGGEHVEMCAGDGKLIGSNNNLPDGTQSVSYDNTSLKSATMVLRAPSS